MFKLLLGDLKRKILLWIHIHRYRRINNHNQTSPTNIFRIENTKVGRYSYGFINVTDHSTSKSILEIGDFCSIAPDVKFILSGEHKTDMLSTFPFKAKFGLETTEAVDKGSIIIKNDVWIGANSLILSGVTVNQGAVIAAGSVVTKDIPAYAIAGGNPAKVIKYRHPHEVIQRLLTIDYSKISKNDIIKKIHTWYSIAAIDNIDALIESINNDSYS